MNIKTVTIIGANGAMGRNIAGLFASFANAKVYMVCRTKEKAEKAVELAALSVKAQAVKANLFACDYDDLEACVADSDLVFDSIVEELDAKLKLNARVSKAAKDDAILCTGTSGLSISKLATVLSDCHKKRFFGMHFFNPPYSLPLCEIIPSEYTDMQLIEQANEFAVKVLHRTVVVVKDSAAFLANRIGFQLINEAMQYAEKYKDNGGVDYIDAILGRFTGRNMAPLNTADFVGLDVHKAIVDNVYANINDYNKGTFVLPAFAQLLIDSGKLGRKSGAGLYKSTKEENGLRVEVYDINKDIYRAVIAYNFPFKINAINALAIGDYETARRALVNSNAIEARICIEFILKYVIYSLYCAAQVSDDIHSADRAMAAGFNWAPPLSLIDFLGGADTVRALIYERLDAQYIQQADIEKLFLNVSKSKYDYRKYFKAKS